MKTNTLFQKSLEQAFALHRNMNKSDMGETHYKDWTKLCSMLNQSAYDSWADTHDQAGNPIQVVDPELAKMHNDVLFELLRKVVQTVGEVKFSDENSALLEVEEKFAEMTRHASRKLGFAKSDELLDIEDAIFDIKQDIKFAEEDFERYNFNGVSQETKDEKKATLDELLAKKTELDNAKKELEKVAYNKTRAYVPCEDNEFRKNFETLIHDMVVGQNATSFAVYRAKKEERRKARRANTKKKKDARKQAEANA